MFKIFSFGFEDIFKVSSIDKINTVMHSFLDDININEFTEKYTDTFSNINYEEKNALERDNFIKIKHYEDMYLLTIDLKGIDLRELSIRYDPGIIEINLNRAELEKDNFGLLARSIIVKKAYNKKFENIEDIDTNQILKSIDNGILSMRMQKKYALESVSNIVDVDCYEDN